MVSVYMYMYSVCIIEINDKNCKYSLALVKREF